jgi:hypothetical protein
VLASPRTYRSLVAGVNPNRRTLPVPPAHKRMRCESLAGPQLDRPWRKAGLPGSSCPAGVITALRWRALQLKRTRMDSWTPELIEQAVPA